MRMDQTAPETPSEDSFTGQVSISRQLFTILGIGIILATLYTSWTPTGLIANSLAGKISDSIAPESEPSVPARITTPTPVPKPRLGIVAGHWGNDSGAVCADGLTEEEVNLTIATLVKQQLVSEGFQVDLLKEFDPLLSRYQALALVSIHADSCQYINDQATGFKVAAALSTTNPRKASRLTTCLRGRYSNVTSLSYHSASITPDMTSYHAFDEINPDTTAAIIETGFLNLDRQILTQSPVTVAEGITQGILCFIFNEALLGDEEVEP